MKNCVSMITVLLSVVLSVFAEDKKPNILFAIADDMSHASAYGYKFLNTPNFDQIAKEGILFNRAYTPSSKCAPSRSVIITGRNPWQLEEAANHNPVLFPKKFKSVVEALGENGYQTGYTGKGWGPGGTGGRLLTGPSYDKHREPKQAKGMSGINYAKNFEDFMSQREVGKPFMFWFGGKEPHRGYEFKSGEKHGKKLSDLDFLPEFWGDSDNVKHDILDYALEVEKFDEHLGKILKHLKKVGEYDNTIIIVTSDNGMPFPRFKGHPYEHSTKLPLAISWQGRIENPGRHANKFTSLIDLAPTFLDVAGISHKDSGMAAIQGKSLADFFKADVKGRDFLITGRERNDIGRPHDQGFPVRSYHEGNFVYMHNFESERWPCGNPETGYRDTDGSPTKSFVLSQGAGSVEFEKCMGFRPEEELYDIVNDPDCMKNLASSPEYEQLKKKMKTKLFGELKRQGDPRMHNMGHVFDAYPHTKKGYYEKFMAEQKTKKNKR